MSFAHHKQWQEMGDIKIASNYQVQSAGALGFNSIISKDAVRK